MYENKNITALHIYIYIFSTCSMILPRHTKQEKTKNI